MSRLLPLGVVLLAAGCSGGGAAVSGTVTLDGQPAAGVSVTFQPVQGGTLGGSYATTDAQGRYALKFVAGDRTGAAVGRHKVVLSLTRPPAGNAEAAAGERLPARSPVRSELTCEVPAGGTAAADFAVTSK